MSQVSESVGTDSTGSTNAVERSGRSSMSLSWIAWNPRMEEPSKPSPSRTMASSRVAAGIEKCCQEPGRSQNFTSTTWTFFSLISSNTRCTSVLVDLLAEAVGRTVVAMDVSRDGVAGDPGCIKTMPPRLDHRTQGHWVSTVPTQARVQAVRSSVAGGFAAAVDFAGVAQNSRLGRGQLKSMDRVYGSVVWVSREFCTKCTKPRSHLQNIGVIGRDRGTKLQNMQYFAYAGSSRKSGLRRAIWAGDYA